MSEGHALGRHYERVVYADRATKRLTTTTWPSHEVAKEVRLKVDACNTSKERIMKTVERAWTKKMLRIASIDVGHWIFHLYMLSIVYHDNPIAYLWFISYHYLCISIIIWLITYIKYDDICFNKLILNWLLKFQINIQIFIEHLNLNLLF